MVVQARGAETEPVSESSVRDDKHVGIRVLLAFGEASRASAARVALGPCATLVGAVPTLEALAESCRALAPQVVVSDLWSDAGREAEATEILAGLAVVRWPSSAPGPSTFVDVSDPAELPFGAWLAWRRRGACGVAPRLRSEVTSVVALLPEPVLFVDGRGEVVASSPAARALLGGSGERALDPLECWGDELRRVVPEPGLERLAESPLARVLFGEAREANGELRPGVLVEAAEMVFPADAATAASRGAWVRLRSGGVSASASHEDSSRGVERQRMELVGRMASGIAHDFNNVMTAVLGFAEFAREDAQEVSVVSDLNELLRAGQRAARLTRKLLMLSRRDDEAVSVDVNDRLQDLTPLLRRAVRSAIDLKVVLSEEAAHVVVDPIHLDQVVLNLVVNARDAVSGAGTIEVRCEVLDGVVRISVSDDGCGIAKENLARVFERGFTTKPHDEGSGLGLSTSRDLIRALGGELSVVSEPGRGSRFSVELPTSATAPFARMEQVSDVPPPRVAGELALVVDGDPEVLRVTSRMLYAAGYRVEAAPDASTAERSLRTLRSETRLLVADTSCVDVRRLFALAARLAPRAALVATCTNPSRIAPDAVGLRKPYTRLAFLDAVHQARARRRPGRRLRVLLVEADDRARKLLGAYLRRDGHEVHEVLDLVTAAVALETVSFDVVVVDEVVLQGSANEAWALARTNDERRPAMVALSSSILGSPEGRLQPYGFDAVIPKPVDPRALTWAIEEHTRTTSWVLVVSDDEQLRATLDDALVEAARVRCLWCDTAEVAFTALEDGFDLALVDARAASPQHGLWQHLSASGVPTVRLVRRPVAPSAFEIAETGTSETEIVETEIAETEIAETEISEVGISETEITQTMDASAVRDVILRAIGGSSAAGSTDASSSVATSRRRGSVRVGRPSDITLRVPPSHAEKVRQALAEMAEHVVALMACLQEDDLVGALSFARELLTSGNVSRGVPLDVLTLATQIESRCRAGELDVATRLAADLAATVSRLRVREVAR